MSATIAHGLGPMPLATVKVRLVNSTGSQLIEGDVVRTDWANAGATSIAPGETSDPTSLAELPVASGVSWHYVAAETIADGAEGDFYAQGYGIKCHVPASTTRGTQCTTDTTVQLDSTPVDGDNVIAVTLEAESGDLARCLFNGRGLWTF